MVFCQKKIKEEIFSALVDRYYKNNELMNVLKISAFCDPRFRTNYVEDAHGMKNLALSHMTKLYEATVSSLNAPDCGYIQQKEIKRGLAKLLDDDDNKNTTNENFMLPSTKAESELNNYLSMPKIDLNQNPLPGGNHTKNHFQCKK